MFRFQGQNADERVKQVTALEETFLKHSHKRRGKRSDLHQLPSLHDFYRKIVETDAYLNLVINKTKELDCRIESSNNELDKQRLVDIKAGLLTFLDTVKHAIVLLQIAKNSLCPEDDPGNDKLLSTSKIVEESTSSTVDTCNRIQEDLIPCDSVQDIFTTTIAKSSLGNINGIPELSYSNSDDEDCFYDASEETPSKGSLRSNIDAVCDTGGPYKKPSLASIDMDSSNVNYDQFYEEDEEDDIGSLESHGSVISHLLSQVKIGMDLTKVVLPTFILERRSLLEMYADFFAHPDLFIRIPDYETAEERFIATVRWYLSGFLPTFLAKRKTSLAKKPYNPVLGEVFKCYWSIPDFKPEKHFSPDFSVPDGPIPWAKCHDLTFIAEQVSHHPPISAFYAEHADKKIMCAAHIYTKSKFLGLSIGVHMVGQGSIYLLERNEEYLVTFPSAYGRSIFTVPWIELGGTVTVNCPQSGYSTTIEFLTKPFYGGKKNKISGEILNPAGKSVLTISGEWTNMIYAKRPNGKQEEFVDNKSMRTIKKIVKPIVEQEPYESRRLWKKVTAALKMQDVDAATNAKNAVEQGQRQLVKERQETNSKWINRVFHTLGDNWYYNNPLSKRLQTNKITVDKPEPKK